MIDLSGFQTGETLYESEQTIVQQATNTENNMPVVLKCAKRDYLTPVRKICLLKDYHTAKTFEISCVIQPIDYYDIADGLIIVYPDTKCVSFNQATRTRLLQTDELIRLLFLTADALDQIHTKQWVHMNLSLDHMLVDSTYRNVFIIDWQSAIKMSGYTIIRPPFYSENPDTIPPELTGFTNDCVDMRTDLYALGCIFYELFTHSPIFREKNLFRQIQAHVLRKPVPPHEGYDPYAPIVQHVPESVSNILMKLLAKNPSERYSSARELKVDIFKCLTDKASMTTVDLPKMALPQVRINSNLYEREESIDKIQSIYNSFAQQSFTDGISTLLLISGEPGTGKTTLCKTLIPWLWKTNGYWFHDSFSCTPDLPAAMFARILSHFFKLTQAHFPNELESQIKQMTYKGLICPPFLLELIPELIPLTAHILPSSQSRNQIISAEPFLMAMFQMLGAKFYPMILCLENLQWADAVSFHLLEKLLQNNNQSFFVIATCDSEEQPAIKTLSTSCQAQNINVYAIGVNNLSQKAVCKCLVDMFNCSFDHAEKISDVVYEKTSGSPRNLHAFLDYLKNQKTMIHEDTPLNLDEAMTIPFHSSLTNLNNYEIMALEKVSCLGISWQMDIACHVTELPVSEMESLIQKAATFGIISPDLSQSNANRTNNTWIFSDVAMHGYFYQNLSQSQCQNIHKRICNHMSGSMAQNSGSAMLYLIASHRSRYPVDNTSKEEFARVYISAGERALMAGLFQSAHVFFEYSLKAFSESDWEDNHQLLFDLNLKALRAASLSSQNQEIEYKVQRLAAHAITNLEKLQFYDCLASIYYHNNQYEKVIETVKQGLSSCKIKIDASEMFRRWTLLKSVLKYRHFQRINPIHHMSDKDLVNQLVIRLFTAYIRSLPHEDYRQSMGVIAKGIQRMSNKQITSDAAYLWIMLSRYLMDVQGFSPIALQWARMGQAIIDRLPDPDLQSETRLIYIWYIDHRSKPLNHHLPLLKEEIQRCAIRGYPGRAAQATEYYLFLTFICGTRLKQILSDMHEISIHTQKAFKKIDMMAMYRQTIHNLISGITPPHILTGQSFDEHKAVETMTSTNNPQHLFILYALKLMLSTLFMNHEKSVLLAQKTEGLMNIALGTPMASMAHFYIALAYTGSYDSAGRSEQKIWRKRIKYHVQQLKKWSDLCSENGSHRYFLILAESAKHLNLKINIAEYYDQAIGFAKSNQYLHEYALANELAGIFFLKQDKEKLARTYIMDAYQAYAKWGADRKVADYARQEKILKSKEQDQTSLWPATIKDHLPKAGLSDRASSLSHDDHETIWHVSQSFCTELKMETLLENIIQTVLRHSGAHKGCLIIKRRQKWFIDAHLNIETKECALMISEPLESSQRVCLPIARQVIQSRNLICLLDAGKQGEYQYDTYIRENNPRSLLCLPVSYNNTINGLLYLENKRLTGLFTTDRVKRMQIIASQAAIAIQNAQIVQTQEKKVQDRASELNLTVHQLSSAVQDLEARSREMMLLNQFSDALHGCQAEKDSYLVLQSYAQQLFPGDMGLLWIGEKDTMQMVISWGGTPPENTTLNKTNCPCLQQQHPVFVEDVVSSPRCESCGPANDHIYLCAPLKDQSGEMGVLHFQFGTTQPDLFDDAFTRRLESRRLLVCRMIEHYALSLANLRLREALKYESRHDPLTGLFNRRHMQALLKSAYANAQQNNQRLGIIMIDIDHFKSFNDTYGHDTGDAVLKHLGAYLKRKISDTFQPCRYGGEEFLVMCPNLSPDDLYQTAEMVRKGIMKDIKVPYENQRLDVTASLGAAFFPEHGENMDMVIQNADKALYVSKENGRNQVTLIGVGPDTSA